MPRTRRSTQRPVGRKPKAVPETPVLPPLNSNVSKPVPVSEEEVLEATEVKGQSLKDVATEVSWILVNVSSICEFSVCSFGQRVWYFGTSWAPHSPPSEKSGLARRECSFHGEMERRVDGAESFEPRHIMRYYEL